MPLALGERPRTFFRGARSFALATLALGSVVACHSSRAHAPGAGEDAWYDAQPLLGSLRPAARVGAAASVGVARLEDLPLYDLDLWVDPAARMFTLSETVWITSARAAAETEIVLREYANATGAVTSGKTPPPVHLVGGACTVGGPCTVTADGASAISVRLAKPLPPGGRLKITLALIGQLEAIDSARTNMVAQGIEGLPALMGGGEGEGDYGLLAVGDGITSLASFYPVLARRGDDGAWERTDKTALGDLGSDDLSNVRASIELPAGAKLATSGVVVSEEASDAGPGRRRAHVVAALVRDFAALASSEFVALQKPVADVTVRSYALAKERAAGERALDVAAWALADYEKRFGAYPYADLDIAEAAIVGGAGGVEFSGLATAASMLYGAPDSGGGGGEISGLLRATGMGEALGQMTGSMLEFCVAHEVAHQYWHGLVGSDSRAHPFADEGLAQYSALLYLEDRYGVERATHDGDLNVKMGYQTMRMLGTPDGAVDQPVERFASSMAYAGLVYGKGPYVYAALRKAMGDDAFFGAVREYVSRYKWQQAPGRGLVDVATSGADGPKLRAIASRWLDEAHGDDDLGSLDLGTMLGGLLGGSGGQLGASGITAGDLAGLLKMLGGDGTDAQGGAGPTKGASKGAAGKKGGAEPSLDELLKSMGGD